jgi:hypothetical protein
VPNSVSKLDANLHRLSLLPDLVIVLFTYGLLNQFHLLSDHTWQTNFCGDCKGAQYSIGQTMHARLLNYIWAQELRLNNVRILILLR